MRNQEGFHDLRLFVRLIYISVGLKERTDPFHNPKHKFKALCCDHFQIVSAYHTLSYTKLFVSLTLYVQPHLSFCYPLCSHYSNHSVGRMKALWTHPSCPGAAPAVTPGPKGRSRRRWARGSHLSPGARPSGALWRRSWAPSWLPTRAEGRGSVGLSLGALAVLPPHPIRVGFVCL